MKTSKTTLLIAFMAIVTVAAVSCKKEPVVQSISLAGTSWIAHDSESEGSITLSDELLLDLTTDSTGFLDMTTYYNGTNVGTLENDVKYQFDGVSSGTMVWSNERFGGKVNISMTYSDKSKTLTTLNERTGKVYTFRKK